MKTSKWAKQILIPQYGTKKINKNWRKMRNNFQFYLFKCQIKDHRLIINDERCQEITKEVLHYQQQQQK